MPKKFRRSDGPLGDKELEELEELDSFLLDADGIEESMDIATLDGFLTAIHCGIKSIMPRAGKEEQYG